MSNGHCGHAPEKRGVSSMLGSVSDAPQHVHSTARTGQRRARQGDAAERRERKLVRGPPGSTPLAQGAGTCLYWLNYPCPLSSWPLDNHLTESFQKKGYTR